MSQFIKSSNHHFIYSIAIKASKKTVWETLINVSDWKHWDTEVKESSLIDDFEIGAKGILVPQKGPKLKFEITQIIEGEMYIFKTKMPIGYLEIKRSLTTKDNVTHFIDDIQFTGFLKHLFGLILGRGFKSILPEVMTNLKVQIENSLAS